MNLRQLKAFQEVMLTGSVTKAARNIGRTQPAVSSLISGLENTIGYDLFVRRAGRLYPVPEAHFMLEKASSILKQVDTLKQTMQSVGSLESGQLRISCLPIFSDRLMPDLISKFVADRPDVKVSVVSERSNDVYNRLASQQFEIGLAEAVPDSPLVESDVVELQCVCAISSADPLSRNAVITPADLDGRDMVCFLPQHFVHKRLIEVFREQGCRLNVRFEMQNAASQYVLVEDALACAVMSPVSMRNYQTGDGDRSKIAFVPFSPVVPYRIAIIRPAHRPLSRLARAFSDLLKQEIEDVRNGTV